jgi:hypothetical protein
MSRFRKPEASCSLSYVEYSPNTTTSNNIYTHKYIQDMYPKMRLLEDTKGGRKEGKEDSE